MAKRYYPLDALTKFTEDATLTATGVIQRSGANVVLKIGAGRQEFSFVVDVESIKTTAGDEHYSWILQGCNVDTFTGADIENLASIGMGATGARQGGAKTSVPGRYALDVQNDQIAEYTYVRLLLVVAGTAPSIKATAFLSER
jgi:hypothetical protein